MAAKKEKTALVDGKEITPEVVYEGTTLPPQEFLANSTNFSGTVRTLTYRPHESYGDTFANYAVTTLTIKDNVVTHILHSQSYNDAEASIKLKEAYARDLEYLKKNYPVGYKFV